MTNLLTNLFEGKIITETKVVKEHESFIINAIKSMYSEFGFTKKEMDEIRVELIDSFGNEEGHVSSMSFAKNTKTDFKISIFIKSVAKGARKDKKMFYNIIQCIVRSFVSCSYRANDIEIDEKEVEAETKKVMKKNKRMINQVVTACI